MLILSEWSLFLFTVNKESIFSFVLQLCIFQECKMALNIIGVFKYIDYEVFFL